MCTWGMIYNRVQHRKKMSRFRSYIAETLVAPVETVANVGLILLVFSSIERFANLVRFAGDFKIPIRLIIELYP